PVTGMAVGGVGSAGAALYTAGGLWGLAAGGVAAAAVGVAVARRGRGRRGLLGGGRLGRGLAGVQDLPVRAQGGGELLRGDGQRLVVESLVCHDGGLLHCSVGDGGPPRS